MDVEFNNLNPAYDQSKVQMSEDGDPEQSITNNISLIMQLEHVIERFRVCIANTHLFWNPAYPHLKFQQAKYLLEKIKEFNTQNVFTFLF